MWSKSTNSLKVKIKFVFSLFSHELLQKNVLLFEKENYTAIFTSLSTPIFESYLFYFCYCEQKKHSGGICQTLLQNPQSKEWTSF